MKKGKKYWQIMNHYKQHSPDGMRSRPTRIGIVSTWYYICAEKSAKLEIRNSIY
jgi:hypothetical protein